ncbi:hypothetical protein RDI58_001523 [Solanum bulbocastanum]|uniref:Uncharacterized protein n=1 Tax=Solanum bulbocastanum TaxID=147425 RepID=A0AAN8U592_SOLBU
MGGMDIKKEVSHENKYTMVRSLKN